MNRMSLYEIHRHKRRVKVIDEVKTGKGRFLCGIWPGIPEGDFWRNTRATAGLPGRIARTRTSVRGRLVIVLNANPYQSSLTADVSSLIWCFSILEMSVGRERPSIFAALDLFPPFRLRASVMSMAENCSMTES